MWNFFNDHHLSCFIFVKNMLPKVLAERWKSLQKNRKFGNTKMLLSFLYFVFLPATWEWVFVCPLVIFFTFLSLLKFLRFSIRLCLSISFIRDAPVVPVCVRALPSQSTPRRLPPWCKLRARSVSRSRCRNWQCRLGTTDHLSRKPEGPRRHPVLKEKIWKVWNNPLLKSTSKALIYSYDRPMLC